MKTLKLLSLLLALTGPLHATTPETPSHHKESTQMSWGTIDTQGVEALINAKVPMTIVDARTDEWFDKTLIAGAHRLPMDATKEVIEKTLPVKKQLVIVYCAGKYCPASKNLAKRLVEEGYKNVIDYHGGIQEWTAHHKPTEKI